MQLRYGELNYIIMWNALKNNEQIVVVLNEDQAEAMDYLIKRMSLVSEVTFSSPAYVAIKLTALFLVNVHKVFKLWFKHRNLAQLDELNRLYKRLRIERSSAGKKYVYVLT